MTSKTRKRKKIMNLNQFMGTKEYLNNDIRGPFVSGENIGLEIEVENLPLPLNESGEGFKTIPPKGWSLHLDRSLRNSGVEFVFATPAGGMEIEKRLKSLESFIDDLKTKPKATNRCSLHVHVNAGNCNTGQLLKWILLYCVYEPLIFSEFAAERESSNFCVPVYQS